MHLTILLLGSLAIFDRSYALASQPSVLQAVDAMNQALDDSVKTLTSATGEHSEIIKTIQSLKSELNQEAPSIFQHNLDAYRHAREQGHLSPKADLNMRVTYAVKAVQQLQTTLMSQLTTKDAVLLKM